MKKVISIMLVLLLMFSLVGCDASDNNGSGNTPTSKNTVYFNTNGGTYVSSFTVSTINSSPKTTKSGYLFVGWFLDEALNTQAVFPLNIEKDTTLYAKWEKIIEKKTVYFNTNGGTYISSIKANTLTSAPTTTKEGYLFDGWFLDKTLTVPAVFPLDVYNDMTLYAKWLKIVGKKYCTNCLIKWDTGFSSALVYDLTPNGFDLVELAKRGYYIKISVSYRVYYRKDYDAWLDIGYAGSPKYEIYLVDSKGVGDRRENLSTSTSGSNRTVELTRPASSLIGDKITLTVSTDNIQNIIFFDSILVNYKCVK